MKSVCILRCGQNIMIVTIPLDSADMHSNDPPHLLTDLKEPAGLKSIVPPPSNPYKETGLGQVLSSPCRQNREGVDHSRGTARPRAVALQVVLPHQAGVCPRSTHCSRGHFVCFGFELLA